MHLKRLRSSQTQAFDRKISTQLADVKSAFGKVASQAERISGQQVHIETEIHSSFRKLQDVVSTREKCVLSEFQQTVRDKLQHLTHHREKLKFACKAVLSSQKAALHQIV